MHSLLDGFHKLNKIFLSILHTTLLMKSPN
jgi:hypothetical protein